ncbi:MAG: cysteine rich repeat-containing protein [Oligoflexia bacterium]|nr:cysteine rich repeat-containing protein [Oligoflexia bacterium]
MFKGTALFIGLLASLISVSSVVRADEAADPAKGALSDACRTDIKQFCSDVTAGGGRVMACLKAHEDKLSAGCSAQWQAARTQVKSKMQASRAACGADIQKFCGNAMGPKEIGSCLDSHTSDLSDSCKSYRSGNKG